MSNIDTHQDSRTAGDVEAALEKIAQSWDGCEYDDVDDIGAALRADFERVIINAAPVSAGQAGQVARCSCPSGDGDLAWPCPRHATESAAAPERSDTPASHIEETRELIEAAERMMRWCVTNVDKWNFSQWDDLDRAVSRLKARIDGNNQGAAEGADRCSTCDGTGHVHRADGEYLGECNCGAAEGASKP